MALPLAASAAGFGSAFTGDARLARLAVGACALNVVSIGLVFGVAVAPLLAHTEPAMKATILAGALAEALNGSCLATLGLPGGAIGAWALYRERSGTLAS